MLFGFSDLFIDFFIYPEILGNFYIREFGNSLKSREFSGIRAISCYEVFSGTRSRNKFSIRHFRVVAPHLVTTVFKYQSERLYRRANRRGSLSNKRAQDAGNWSSIGGPWINETSFWLRERIDDTVIHSTGGTNTPET